MKVLVTGSEGKIGSNLKAHMGDFEVIPFDIALNAHDDIARYAPVANAVNVHQPDAIVHLAAIPGPIEPDFTRLWEINCIGTFNIVNRAIRNNVKRIVFASSLSYYGHEKGIPHVEPLTESTPPMMTYLKAADLTCDPKMVGYGQSKVIAESILAYYGLARQIEVVCLRFGEIGRLTANDTAARAIVAALNAPGPFWYETLNITDTDAEADNTKMAQLLEPVAA